MKKICLIFIFTLILFEGIFTVSAMAQNVGDTLGNVLHSDIKVYINDKQIAGYNIDGWTYIVAEDLPDYGFQVEWNPAERSLSVTAGTAGGEPDFIAESGYAPGTAAFPYVYTDIAAYLNGKEVTSYNIQGKTVILAEDLANEFGSFYWDAESRKLLLTAQPGTHGGSSSELLPKDVSTVSIVRAAAEDAESITKDGIYAMVKEALEQTNFYDIIQNGQTVVLKPNLVQMTMPPSHELLPKEVNGITTDWRVTAAVASEVRACNPDGKIYVMEGSSGGATDKVMEYYNYTAEYMPEVDGFVSMESDCGDWRDYNSPYIEKAALPDGRLHKEYYFNKILYNADVLISIPVLKTSSGGVVVTASIKNVSLGAPPGNIYNVSPTNNTKFDMVSHNISDGDLDNWIFDYFMCKPITFAVVDGLQGYQNGPNAMSDGSYEEDVMNMMIIMAGSDAVAIDSVCSYVMGWDPSGVGYLNHFNDSGVGATDVSHIYVTGEKVDELRRPFSINDPELGGLPLKSVSPPEFNVETKADAGGFDITITSENAVKAEVYTDALISYAILDGSTYSFSVASDTEKIRIIAYDESFNKSEKVIELK